MIKKMLMCFFSIVMASCTIFNTRADVAEHDFSELVDQNHYQVLKELQDQNQSNQSTENLDVPDMIDIFGGVTNDELFEKIDAVEQRDDLTLLQKVQLVLAYLKACSVQEIKEHITEHLQQNAQRYLVAASVTTLFVATILLSRSIEASMRSKTYKTKKSRRA